ncbi:glutathione synthase [Lipomyces oligophaga]|uniref:glutathione synthase n=1 Tax=Lipomyces oligophaga TaxID=45792 RepID=UPI0034CD5E83
MSQLLCGKTYPPKLSPDETASLSVALRDWALSHGLVIRAHPTSVSTTTDADILATHVPLTLFPSPFPKALFEEARELQLEFQNLYARVADDMDFLAAITEKLAGVDEFMHGLWKLHLEVSAETGGVPVQPLTLGVFRSDYLLHAPSPDEPISLRQVELNTISASFMGLSSRAADAHNFLRKAGHYPEVSDIPVTAETNPVNPASTGIARGLALAHKAYGVANAVVLFVVQPTERNAFDQRWLEYLLLQNHSIRVLRATLADIAANAVLDRSTHMLMFKGQRVSVVYYRCGYTPDDYPTPDTWEARKTMELSDAIKCPSIATHFAGAKKIQQVLVEESILAKYCPDVELRARIRATFADILPLDDSPLGEKARQLIRSCPEKYVLKPQREGGGNNVYREKIPEFLASLPDESYWNGYILMELIEPPIDITNSIMRLGEIRQGPVVSELGVYGCVLWDTTSSTVLENFEAGWLLRTKFTDSDEGGVAAGFGSIDSVLLV